MILIYRTFPCDCNLCLAPMLTPPPRSTTDTPSASAHPPTTPHSAVHPLVNPFRNHNQNIHVIEISLTIMTYGCPLRSLHYLAPLQTPHPLPLTHPQPYHSAVHPLNGPFRKHKNRQTQKSSNFPRFSLYFPPFRPRHEPSTPLHPFRCPANAPFPLPPPTGHQEGTGIDATESHDWGRHNQL